MGLGMIWGTNGLRDAGLEEEDGLQNDLRKGICYSNSDGASSSHLITGQGCVVNSTRLALSMTGSGPLTNPACLMVPASLPGEYFICGLHFRVLWIIPINLNNAGLGLSNYLLFISFVYL